MRPLHCISPVTVFLATEEAHAENLTHDHLYSQITRQLLRFHHVRPV